MTRKKISRRDFVKGAGVAAAAVALGAARVATRQGLQGKSYELAAEGCRYAVGGEISKDSLRRINTKMPSTFESAGHLDVPGSRTRG